MNPWKGRQSSMLQTLFLAGLILLLSGCEYLALGHPFDMDPEANLAGGVEDEGGEGGAWSYDFSNIDYRDMVDVPGGTFMQSDRDDTESFDHTLSAFSLAKYEVTYELWRTVYLWAVDHGYSFETTGQQGSEGTAGASPIPGNYEPVADITCQDAIVWCNAYSEMSALTPVYYTNNAQNVVLKIYGNANISNSCVKWDADGFRLPTEGEWVFAASYLDGITFKSADHASGAFAAWDDVNDNYDDNGETGSNGSPDNLDANNLVAVYDKYWAADSTWKPTGMTQTHAVDDKEPNPLGLHLMAGNVREWCWDWEAPYPSTSQNDYRGPETVLTQRIQHGGSFNWNADWLALGYRSSADPTWNYEYYGFRVARRK